MEKLIEQLFIKDKKLDTSFLHDSLYISFDEFSALRTDYMDVVKKLKKHTYYQIIKNKQSVLSEGYSQGLFIIKIESAYYFVRLILSDGKMYDALVYSIVDMDLILRVFFSKIEEVIPSDLNGVNEEKIFVIIKIVGRQYKIVKASSKFYEMIGYEDWDFANKFENNLKEIMEQELESRIVFKCGSGSLVWFEFNKKTSNNYLLMEEW